MGSSTGSTVSIRMTHLQSLWFIARYGWTWVRGTYVLIGVGIMVNSLIHFEWLGVMMGTYLFLMGLFAFGCAGGACAAPINQGEKPGDAESHPSKF